MTRRAMGDEPRTEFLHVRLTPAERIWIEHRAAVAGVTVSAWTLQTLLAGRDNESGKSVPLPPHQPAMVFHKAASPEPEKPPKEKEQPRLTKTFRRHRHRNVRRDIDRER